MKIEIMLDKLVGGERLPPSILDLYLLLTIWSLSFQFNDGFS